MSDRGVNVQWLQQRVTDLEAEVERLREERDGFEGLYLRRIDNLVAAEEALRRVVEKLESIKSLESPDPVSHALTVHKLVVEALAFAKGVSTGAATKEA